MPINRRPGPDEHPHERPGQCPPTPAPGQGPRGPDGLPRADRPSIRVAMAASLLRHGRDPVRVAERTQVPLALVELLAEHAGGDRHCVRPRRSAGCQSSTPKAGLAAAVAGALVGPRGDVAAVGDTTAAHPR
jgi:hypothetical protein